MRIPKPINSLDTDMKRIVICCDGTWNRLDARHQTNVAKIAEAMLPRDAAGNAQVMLHLDGVGSGRGTGHLAQGMDRWLGGVLGIGLTEVIQEAYRFLVLNYDPGDEIMIFGFSRGAYTARSLGGMIRRCGIMEKRFASRVADAIELYRARSDGAKTPGDRARRFRAVHSPRVVTEPEVEVEWRRAAGLVGPDDAPPVLLAVRYLGIWDTVGSLGVPAGLLPIPASERFRFHDVDLAETVHAARHALALDEHRFDFNATEWDNLPKIEAKLPAAEQGRRLQQWFPGVHGAVRGRRQRLRPVELRAVLGCARGGGSRTGARSEGARRLARRVRPGGSVERDARRASELQAEANGAAPDRPRGPGGPGGCLGLRARSLARHGALSAQGAAVGSPKPCATAVPPAAGAGPAARARVAGGIAAARRGIAASKSGILTGSGVGSRAARPWPTLSPRNFP